MCLLDGRQGTSLGRAMANDPMNTGHPMDYGMHSAHGRPGKDPTLARHPRAALASAMDPPGRHLR